MKKLFAFAAGAALVLSSTPALAGGDPGGDLPPGDPIEELADFFCKLGAKWLCPTEPAPNPTPSPSPGPTPTPISFTAAPTRD